MFQFSGFFIKYAKNSTSIQIIITFKTYIQPILHYGIQAYASTDDISSITLFEFQIKRKIKIKSTNAKTLPLAKK